MARTIIDAMQEGMGIMDAFRKAQRDSIDTELYPQTARTKLDLEKANAGIAGNTLNYAPQMSEADLGYKRAQTGFTTEQTRLLPIETLIKAQQGVQSASRFGAAYQMSKALDAMSPAARELWISQNQADYNQMLVDLGNRQNMSLITPQVLDKYFPGMGLAGGIAPVSPSGTNFKGSTPDQVNAVQKANEIAANNSLVTGKTRTQLEGAIQVESVLNDPDLQQRAKNAASYVGVLGKGKAAIAALSQQNPRAYEDYLSFKHQDMPLILNRIKTLDGMGATDSQRDELHGLYNRTMDSLTSNSPQFITQFNNLGNALDRVSRAVQKSATPIANVNRLEGFKAIGSDARVQVISPDGKRGTIPADRLNAAMQAGYKQAQ